VERLDQIEHVDAYSAQVFNNAASNGAVIKVTYDMGLTDITDVQDEFAAKIQAKTLDIVD
jgi:hypothetical protein